MRGTQCVLHIHCNCTYTYTQGTQSIYMHIVNCIFAKEISYILGQKHKFGQCMKLLQKVEAINFYPPGYQLAWCWLQWGEIYCAFPVWHIYLTRKQSPIYMDELQIFFTLGLWTVHIVLLWWWWLRSYFLQIPYFHNACLCFEVLFLTKTCSFEAFIAEHICLKVKSGSFMNIWWRCAWAVRENMPVLMLCDKK